jgi:hypothetical protein
MNAKLKGRHWSNPVCGLFLFLFLPEWASAEVALLTEYRGCFGGLSRHGIDAAWGATIRCIANV